VVLVASGGGARAAVSSMLDGAFRPAGELNSRCRTSHRTPLLRGPLSSPLRIKLASQNFASRCIFFRAPQSSNLVAEFAPKALSPSHLLSAHRCCVQSAVVLISPFLSGTPLQSHGAEGENCLVRSFLCVNPSPHSLCSVHIAQHTVVHRTILQCAVHCHMHITSQYETNVLHCTQMVHKK
jgi:hypothetical protein